MPQNYCWRKARIHFTYIKQNSTGAGWMYDLSPTITEITAASVRQGGKGSQRRRSKKNYFLPRVVTTTYCGVSKEGGPAAP